jgi:hypothetical protein
MSECSLSSAVRNSLSLEERVIGRERPTTGGVVGGGGGGAGSFSSIDELTSPSTILQSRSRRGMLDSDANRGSPSEKADYSALSGLAALSTAAFLKLDEAV